MEWRSRGGPVSRTKFRWIGPLELFDRIRCAQGITDATQKSATMSGLSAGTVQETVDEPEYRVPRQRSCLHHAGITDGRAAFIDGGNVVEILL